MLHQKFLPEGLKKAIAYFLACLFIIVFTGCNSNKKVDDKKTGIEPTAATTFKMNCVRLEKSQIQAWVDSGWTNPSYANRIRTLLFQFYTAYGTNASQNMQLITYPGKSFVDVRVTGRANLAIDTTCTPLILSGAAILANNSINIKDLNILNADGSLKDFDFLRLRPVQGPGEYVSFEMEVVKVVAEKENILTMMATHPCPPYCPTDAAEGED